MMGENASQEAIEEFKGLVSEVLTPYASSILLDPEYGLPAAKKRAANSGLLIAYEKKRAMILHSLGDFPDLLPFWSAQRIKQKALDAVKFLLYYDIDESKRKKKSMTKKAGICGTDRFRMYAAERYPLLFGACLL